MISKELLQDVVFCNEKDSILEVSRVLRDTQNRHLVVVDAKRKPVGIISTVDVNNRVVAEGKNPSTTLAKDIMTKPIETVDISITCEEAYQKMIKKGTYSIPVTDKNQLVGSLNFDQILRKVC